MSLFGMTRRALPQPRPFAEGVTAATRRATPGPSALEKLVDYIPSEVLAIYIAGFGIIQPTSCSSKLGIFLIGAVLAPVFIGVSDQQLRKENGGGIKFSLRRFVVLVIVAWISYTVWVAAIPESVLADLRPDMNRIATFAACVLTALLARLGKYLGLEGGQG
jgi:hypothetical protein